MEDESESGLLTCYEPISPAAIRGEDEVLRAVASASWQEWQAEVSKYEQERVEGGERVPNRNYPNPEGRVTDSELFPYHTSCYPLLDAYSFIAEDRVPRYDQPIVPPISPPRLFLPLIPSIPGTLPCSPPAIEISILGQLNTDKMALIDIEWNCGIVKPIVPPDDSDFGSESSRRGFGVDAFPSQPQARADILLKILRHAKSDIQNDFQLANAVILRLSEWKLCQDVNCFRKALSIIGTEARECDGNCVVRWMTGETDEPPDHRCEDVSSGSLTLSLLRSICSLARAAFALSYCRS